MRLTSRPNFDGEKYFRKKFTELNEDMKGATGKAYPEYVVAVLASLQARMSSLNPGKRPTAIKLIETIQNLAIYPWDIDYYAIR
jgi:hypothetical protein